jgi:hypothetical protein
VEFSGVAPGRYELVQGDPPRLSELDATASQQVDPALGAPAVSVSGFLRAAFSSRLPDDSTLPPGSGLPDDITLTLNPPDGAHRLGPLQATVVRGAFSFPLVPAGSWELWAESGGLQLPILSVSVGSRMVAGNRIRVQDRALSLVVRLSQGGPRIEGFVRKGSQGVAGVLVVLVPRNPALLRSQARRDQSDSDGSFSLRDVAPGQYTVVAIQDGWKLDWARPGALAGYLAHGVAVKVTDQSGKPIQLSQPVPAQAP